MVAARDGGGGGSSVRKLVLKWQRRGESAGGSGGGAAVRNGFRRHTSQRARFMTSSILFGVARINFKRVQPPPPPLNV